MLKIVVAKVMWMGRATVFAVGLAVVVGLTLAVGAGTAEAAKAASLKAGVQNAIKATTSIVGTLAGPILRLDNNGTGPALDLQVEPGKAPVTVNSDTKVENLNVDKLDGKDGSTFLGPTYVTVESELITTTGAVQGEEAFCDAGDPALGGGGDPGTNLGNSIIVRSVPVIGNGQPIGWQVDFKNAGTEAVVATVHVVCGDLGQPHG